MVCGLVQCTENVFTEHNRHDDASGDSGLVAMLEQPVLNCQLLPSVCVRLERGIGFELVSVDARVVIQKVDDAYDDSVGALLHDPIDPCVQAISFGNRASVRGNASS